MSNYDSNILTKNIKNLMSSKSITQEKLADILEMSQPNVSKALSETDKKSFTLNQVAGIAKYFNVSIDTLVGNDKTTSSKYSPRYIGTVLSKMIEEGDAEYFTIKKEEEVYDVDYVDIERKLDVKVCNIEYPAIYMRSYWTPPSNPTNQEEYDLTSEAVQAGNESRMLPVNTFLKLFKEIHDAYKRNALSEETYRTIVADLLSHLYD